MAIKFETNIPLKLVFPYGDFREVSSHYGQQYAYSVGAPRRVLVVSLS